MAFIGTPPGLGHLTTEHSFFRARHHSPRVSNSRPNTSFARANGPVRRKENAAGQFYVDSSCIDCDTCRWFCPDVFHRAGNRAAVHTQPEDQSGIQNALLALQACPTGSIHTEEPLRTNKETSSTFPQPAVDRSVSPPGVIDGVYYNGDTSRHTFGASSWTALTSSGAIMFDCPRYSERLAKKLESIAAPYGGFQYIVLSHQDDVHDHDRWASRLNAKRVIHSTECNRSQRTDECEIQLSDADFPYKLNEEATVYHVPGHTEGSVALHHIRTKSLFTGDHLGWSQTRGGLIPSKQFCFYSWNTQRESVLALAEIDFLHGWPGHGRPFHFLNRQHRKKEIENTAKLMKDAV